MERVIVHYDLDCFFVAVERLRDSRLVGKPVMVGGLSDRAVVSACSYETRRFGVHSAMPMRLARQLCPEAIVLRGDFEAYSQQSKLITDILTEHAPVVEKASIDEFYLDFSGMERFVGTYRFATELRHRVTKESGLALSMGLSTSKVVSKVATNEAKPNGQLQVALGQEKPFLAPLSVSKMPMIGEVTAHQLRQMGIQRVGTLSQMPIRLLEGAFGKQGKVLWERANGIDLTPVVPYSDPKSLSSERTFEQDTTDVSYLRQVLIRLTESLTYDLRKGGHTAGCLTLKLRYANFDTHTKQVNLPCTSADHVLIPQVLELFERLYDRRLLIRLVGVRLSKLVRGVAQLNLFDQSARLAPLYLALDKIRDKYGGKIIGRAAAWSKPSPKT